MGASFAGVAPGADGQWLLNSLVVVIVGGLGSLKGAVAGSLLFGLVVSFSPCLPARGVHLLQHHLDLRAAGSGPRSPAIRSVRETGVSASPSNIALGAVAAALVALPLVSSEFVTSSS